MGTKVHCESYLPGYYSMRDHNEDSNSSNWPLFYGDRTLANGQYCNGFLPRTVTNAYCGYEKYALKQTMLEHEAIFKHQVFELHRLYKIQKDMMDEIRRKELYNHRIPIETPLSSSRLVSQMPYEDAPKWQKSISGAQIITSPLNCTEANSKQAGQTPFQNGCTSKDCEILEYRPSKIRKKLFDLQLPAEEYIDTEEGEKATDNKISEFSSYPPSTNHKIASERSEKLNLGGSAKIDCNGNASRSGSFLADLNEPIQVEEVILPTSVDFLGRGASRGEIKDLDLSGKAKSPFLLGLPMEILQNSQHRSSNGTSFNLHVENTGKGREWPSYSCEAGHSKAHLNSSSQGLPDRSLMTSQLKHTVLNKAHQPIGILPFDQSRRDLWRERAGNGPEVSDRSRDVSSFNHLEPFVASHMPNPYPLLHSDLDNAWSHSISTWGKPSNSLTQKLTSTQTHPQLNSLSSLNKSPQSSAPSHEIFGDKWHLHSSSGSKPGFGSGLPSLNGFYHGSASGSKDLPTHFPPVGFDYLNCNKDDKVVSELLINYGPRSYLNSSSVIDMSPKDVKWNTPLSKGAISEVVIQKGLEIMKEEKKCEDHLKVLPWFKAKPAFKIEGTSTRRDSNSSEISFLQATSNQFSSRSEPVKGPNQLFAQNITLSSFDRDVGAMRNAVGNSPVNKKILGFPIFDDPCPPKTESSSLVSTSASLQCAEGKGTKEEGKMRLIDINMACDPECGAEIAAGVFVEKVKDKGVSNFRAHIDLNSCVTEEEITLAPSVASASVNVKIAVVIDLEAPAFPETEEEDIPPSVCEMPLKSPQDKAELPQDEVIRVAAEAIVAISSCDRINLVKETTCQLSKDPSPNPLLWFVEVVSSFGDDIENKFGKESKGKNGEDNELDDFEAMTLNLPEVTEEEYVPKPFVPDIHKVEETGPTSLPNRPRRGQARRGRQRRDFQRDILPGLASLSRHEVTEDLQTFGGLMRATGHSWQSGLTRRNGARNGGAARGRRRLVVDPAPVVVATTPVCTLLMQQLNSIEVGLEDRSLRGWGKTPRRPRRQRCPAGNLPSILLT